MACENEKLAFDDAKAEMIASFAAEQSAHDALQNAEESKAMAAQAVADAQSNLVAADAAVDQAQTDLQTAVHAADAATDAARAAQDALWHCIRTNPEEPDPEPLDTSSRPARQWKFK